MSASSTATIAAATAATAAPSSSPRTDLINFGVGHGFKYKQGKTDYETILVNFDPFYQPALDDDDDDDVNRSDDDDDDATTVGSINGADRAKENDVEAAASSAPGSANSSSNASPVNRRGAGDVEDAGTAGAAAEIVSPHPHSPPPSLPPRLYRFVLVLSHEGICFFWKLC